MQTKNEREGSHRLRIRIRIRIRIGSFSTVPSTHQYSSRSRYRRWHRIFRPSLPPVRASAVPRTVVVLPPVVVVAIVFVVVGIPRPGILPRTKFHPPIHHPLAIAGTDRRRPPRPCPPRRFVGVIVVGTGAAAVGEVLAPPSSASGGIARAPAIGMSQSRPAPPPPAPPSPPPSPPCLTLYLLLLLLLRRRRRQRPRGQYGPPPGDPRDVRAFLRDDVPRPPDAERPSVDVVIVVVHRDHSPPPPAPRCRWRCSLPGSSASSPTLRAPPTPSCRSQRPPPLLQPRVFTAAAPPTRLL